MINQPAFAIADVADHLRLSRILFRDCDDDRAFFAPLDRANRGAASRSSAERIAANGRNRVSGSGPDELGAPSHQAWF